MYTTNRVLSVPSSLFILMHYPIRIDTISMSLSILYFKGFSVQISINGVFLSLKIVFILANSADPDEMLPYAAFHLGIHCLRKYMFIDIQNETGKVEYALIRLNTVFLAISRCSNFW